MITRRNVFKSSLLIPFASSYRAFGIGANPSQAYDLDCGVASGDPTADSVVIWTRVPPKGRDGLGAEQSLQVAYEVALSPEFAPSSLVASGQSTTSAKRDFTVKVRVADLKPQTTYYYRFLTESSYISEVGRTKTAPIPGDLTANVKIAFVTCQKFSDGLYTAYHYLCQEDIDLCLHLGDHIYETENGRPSMPDPLQGAKAKTLEDYRAKYRYYLSDPNWREARRLFPWVDIWSDHEVYNDYAGSVNRLRNPKQFSDGYQAFLEYMPFESTLTTDLNGIPTLPINRTISYGSLVEIFATDQRQYRSAHPGHFGNKRHCKERTMLGIEQKNWLKEGLAASKAQWKLVMSEVMMSPLRVGLNHAQAAEKTAHTLFGEYNSHQERGFYLNLDQWDGYPAERYDILNFIEQEQIKNVVVATGDIHAAFDALLYTDSEQTEGRATAVEIVTSSISSTTIGRDVRQLAGTVEWILRESNPQIHGSDITNSGYAVLTISQEGVAIRHMGVTSVTEQGAGCLIALAGKIPDGQAKII